MVEIIRGMSNQEYHAHKALGSSGMKELLKTPLHYWEKYLNPDHEKEEQTAALRFGSLYDCMVLEPEQFHDRYVLEGSIQLEEIPEKRTLKSLVEELENKEEAKLAYDKLNKTIEEIKIRNGQKLSEFQSSGKEIVKYDDYLKAKKMKDNLMAKNLSFIIEKAEKQVSIFWDDPITGVRLKIRPDLMVAPGLISYFPNGVLLDLKSTKDASPEEFGKDIFKYGYHISAEHYLSGFKKAFNLPEDADVPFYWICSEKNAPYDSVFRNITFEQKIHGQYYARKAIDLFANAVKESKWQGYSESPESAITPAWINKEINAILNGEM